MTPARQVLADVEARGVELRAVGDVLQWRPCEALPPALVGKLREHKAELLALLRSPERVAVSAPPEHNGCEHCRRSRAEGYRVLACSCGWSLRAATRAAHQ